MGRELEESLGSVKMSACSQAPGDRGQLTLCRCSSGGSGKRAATQRQDRNLPPDVASPREGAAQKLTHLSLPANHPSAFAQHLGLGGERGSSLVVVFHNTEWISER